MRDKIERRDAPAARVLAESPDQSAGYGAPLAVRGDDQVAVAAEIWQRVHDPTIGAVHLEGGQHSNRSRTFPRHEVDRPGEGTDRRDEGPPSRRGMDQQLR